MSGKGPGEMAAITSAGGVQVDSVLLPSVRRRFELIFQDDDDASFTEQRTSAQCHVQQTVQISV